MNVPIARLFVLVVLLFTVLVGFSSRWAVFGATRLRDNKHNSRVVLEEQQVKRGIIRADDGTVLAGSTALTGGRYARRYPPASCSRCRSASTPCSSAARASRSSTTTSWWAARPS